LLLYADAHTETDTEEETSTSSASSATGTAIKPDGRGAEFIIPAETLEIEDGETGGNIFELGSAFVQVAVLVDSTRPEA